MKKNDSGTNNESGKSEAGIQNKKKDLAFQAKAALLPKEATHHFSAEFWIEKPNLQLVGFDRVIN